ncbi:MAG TPA: DUF4142 domain-containing protein [Lacunisphaera sp.]|nr:DUF4142 domain-containing protein [Lacunisphaera sp.]
MKHYRALAFVRRATCAAALACVAALPATAQVESPRPRPLPPASPAGPLPPEGFNAADPTPIPSRQVERFISKISILQTEEAQLSAIASQRASSEQIRSFASQVRSSSQTRDQELAQLAQARRVLLPTGKASNDLAQESETWQKKDAKDFDEDYVKRIIRVQKNAINTLDDYAREADADPELAAFAQKHLTALRESVRQAEALEKQVD